jgi:glycosyltransferase involved in cell wall biosynthesis
LRVALLAGTLVQSGAEKQLVYIARALCEAGIAVRVYCLTRGEYYESALRALGVQVCWVGQSANPLARLAALTIALREFRPHILQSAHFFTNLYIAGAGRLWRSISVGAVRNDTLLDVEENGKWGRWLLHMPSVLVANSYTAKHNAEKLGVPPTRVHMLPNVIDLHDFDDRRFRGLPLSTSRSLVVAVGRLALEKRWERFLAALAFVRREAPGLQGLLIGEGSDRQRLEAIAADLGLLPDGVVFLGHRDDVPALLNQAAMLVLCSDHEGVPNVVIEAMAAYLPVITTPAGDAGVVVEDGTTGYVVPFDDIDGIARRMMQLDASPDLCRKMGLIGRQRVEQHYSFSGLTERLVVLYQSIAESQERRQVAQLLASGRGLL